MKIGFIGLGVMGRPMAGHLIAAGHEVFLNRVKAVSQYLVEAGGKALDTARAVTEVADVIILMLPDTPDVEAVLFCADGVAEALSASKLVIDMSSISPVATKEFATRIAEKGAGYVDAPVSGGEVGANAASLTIMVGASVADFERAKPLLEKLGSNITHVGNVGAGQTTKVANQVIVGLTIEAVAEGLALAQAAGADPVKVREALMGGFASSRILEVHGERMIKGTFDPGFRIRLHRKDVGLALDAAKTLQLELPHLASLERSMDKALAGGLGDKDHSALFKLLQPLSDCL
ncbi:2-hydroxy-3-oxopropionate reductase [Agrobacterium tumefaciens]|uniref:2-hydroxy-3-oxopropionate reductase n=1 Tax=Agrobacterium tumefaciens TaxID=358 RepID=UPI00157488C9|nr:2-hydroxy-3-oxopropionate reductase [Agrobacterium tumefaciens]NTE65137.1 2-hydroxy-3-oxopropionate reductase [Agrobacterium tumefaciens]